MDRKEGVARERGRLSRRSTRTTGIPVCGWTPTHSTLTSNFPSGVWTGEIVARVRGPPGFPPEHFGMLISWKSESKRPYLRTGRSICAVADRCARITSPALLRSSRPFLLRLEWARFEGRRDPPPMLPPMPFSSPRPTAPRAAHRATLWTKPRPSPVPLRLSGTAHPRTAPLWRESVRFRAGRFLQLWFPTDSGGASPTIARVRRPTLRTCERTTVVRSAWSRSSACG